MNDCTEPFHRDHEDERHDHPRDDGGYAAKRCGHIQSPYGLIAEVDILAHFTWEELDPLRESVAERLAPVAGSSPASPTPIARTPLV
jgi:hypothetical protein